MLFAASIHGNEDMIPKLYHQIQEWPKQSRGAIAADAVMALSLNPSPRYFSETVLQLAKVTASVEKRDEDWRKEAGL